MKIIQIVGYKNSGKTTLSTGLIQYLVERNFKVASLKHHGHGGFPLGISMTDSKKQKDAGSFLAGVEGSGMLQLLMDNWDLEKILTFYQQLGTEILVIEGYKKLPFPKVVILKQEEDFSLLGDVDSILAILTPILSQKTTQPYKVFKPHEMKQLFHWLFNTYFQEE